MTDAFDDLADSTDTDSVDSDTDEQDGNEDKETVSVTDSAATFADAYRQTLPSPDESRSEKRYESEETGKQADDVDPRGLFRNPSINEIRYYAREGPYGRAIIKKPVDDAFKHSFKVIGDNTKGETQTNSDGTIEEFLREQYVPQYTTAQIKSRRDGLAVLMHVVSDNAESVSEPIDRDTASFEGFQIWTLDNLSQHISAGEVVEHTEYDVHQVYITEGDENGGVVVVDDISHPDHGKVIGYGVEPRNREENIQTATFVHADRCEHFVWGEHVDGPLKNDVTGEQVGESVLTPILQPLMAAQMGYWAMKNILFRYSAPLHAVEPPESWGTDEWDAAKDQLEDYSMASDGLLPPGAELTVAEGVSEFDPQPVYDVLENSICAGTVFTKTVLQGTQTGTVSGSETDIKGYFNNIQVLREQEFAEDMRAAVQKVAQYDQQTIPRASAFSNWEIEWGPLLKPTDMEQAEGAVSLMTGLVSGINQYVLTPDEARSILSEEWASFDIDIDLDELTEDQKDDLDRINVREVGRGPQDDEPDVRENPRMQNGGGQPDGQTRESSQPQRADSADHPSGLDDETMDALATRVAEKLSDTDSE